MKFLARLMSHGFAIGLVVLLAFGFIYRGELFPEWELPGFLVFDSEKDSADDQLAAKIEPAPIKEDRMASGTAASSQDVADVKDDFVSPGAARGIPPAEEVVESGAAAIADITMSPVVEGPLGSDKPAVTGTAEVPDNDIVRAPVEQAAALTGSGDVAITSAQTPALDHAGIAAKSATPGTDSAAGMDSVTAIAAAAMDAKPARGDAGSSVLYPGAAGEDTLSLPAGKTVAEVPDATVVAGLDDTAAQAGAGAATAPLVTATGVAKGSGPAHAPAGLESSVISPAPAVAGPGLQDTGSKTSTEATVSSYTLLALAREAYWMRDYQAAEDSYRQLILNDPENPDGYGELANMYFSQGNWEAAASAYYEAGSRLVKSGLLAPARELVDVIRGLNGPQADALEHEIEMAESDSQ